MSRFINLTRLQVCFHLLGLGFHLGSQTPMGFPAAQFLFDPCARRNLTRSFKVLALSFLLPALLSGKTLLLGFRHSLARYQPPYWLPGPLL